MDYEDEMSLLDRRIEHANKVVQIHDKIQTPTIIIFSGSKTNQNINISQKHRELFREILKIDENAKVLDDNDKEYSAPEDIPDGMSYSKAFTIDDSDKKFGSIYVKCTILSTFSLWELKNGPMNIMQHLKENNIFFQFRKFKTIREASIGFLHSIHPIATLRSELREDLNTYLKSMTLNKEEFETLYHNTDVEEVQEGRGEIVFPSYDLVVNNIGY